ncbi:MAG: helix-turn-helix transcriptional regulator [Mycobacteriales bacterium]
MAVDRRRGMSVQRVLELSAEQSDSRMLRAAVIAAIGVRVRFGNYAWLLTDPRTAVGSDPLADVPSLRELPALIRSKYLTEINRWTELSRSGQSVQTLVKGTRGGLSRSRQWREVQSAHSVGDVASLVFADRFGCWAFLDLWRDASDGPFGDDETEFLSLLVPGITAALRVRQARTFSAPTLPQRHQLGPVVLVLDDELTVGGQTAATQDWLRALIPAESGRPAIPASVYNVAAQLLANEQGVDANDPASRVHLADGFWVTLRAARLGSGDGPAASPIAVTLEETSPGDRLDLFSRAFALTVRESEVMSALATGEDTRELARRLFLSESTVQDHLKAIFAKTGARSRGALVSRALGTRPDSG